MRYDCYNITNAKPPSLVTCNESDSWTCGEHDIVICYIEWSVACIMTCDSDALSNNHIMFFVA
jgi:hypothetical protein